MTSARAHVAFLCIDFHRRVWRLHKLPPTSRHAATTSLISTAMASFTPSAGALSAHSDVLDGPIPDSDDAKLRLVQELKNRGRAAVGAKSWRDASLLYKRACAISPNDAVLHANLALTLINMGLYEEARVNAVKSTELDATYVKGFWRLGQALEKLKRTSEALDAMKHALELDPSNKALQKEVTRLTQQLKEEEELMKMDIDYQSGG